MKAFISKQREFFNTHTTKDLNFRISQLNLLEKILRENQDKLDEAIYDDFKKSSFENYLSELALLFHVIKEDKQKVRKWSRKPRIYNGPQNYPGSV